MENILDDIAMELERKDQIAERGAALWMIIWSFDLFMLCFNSMGKYILLAIKTMQ